MSSQKSGSSALDTAPSFDQMVAHMAALVEQSEDAILSASLDGKIRMWNRGARKLYGYSAEEIIGSPVAILFPPGAREEFEETSCRLAAGKVVSYPDTPRLRKDGTVIRVWTSVSPIRDESGRVIGGSCIARDVGEQVRVKKEIEAINDELRRLCGQLLRSEDQARRRIARELHDGAVQELAAIELNLTALLENPALSTDGGARELVEHSLELANAGSRGLRTLSYLLHPPLLDELGLATAVQTFVEGFTKRTGISVQVKSPLISGRLAPDVELALFRIVQESLANVHRHSGSRTVEIRSEWKNGHLTLEIEDHGRGIEDAQPGVGIPGMKERARQLGGRLEIESRPGRTVVQVRLPLSE